jgi:hypothetical protein
MGHFTFILSDSNRKLAYGELKTPVYLITEDGQVFKTTYYNGYGDFGGKDIFVLIGEINGFTGSNEEIRDRTFREIFARGITNGEKTFTHEVDFHHYEYPIKEMKNLTPNQIVKNIAGWRYFGSNMDFNEVDKKWKLVKLVGKLPSKKNWKERFNAMRYPKSTQ